MTLALDRQRRRPARTLRDVGPSLTLIPRRLEKPWAPLGGARTATERAHDLWRQILETYVPPPLDAAVDEALRRGAQAVPAKRRRERERSSAR